MQRVVLTIDGMSCSHCEHAVHQALDELGGVAVERVDIGSALVAYDGDQVGVERIRAAVEDGGYAVRSVQQAS